VREKVRKTVCVRERAGGNEGMYKFVSGVYI